MRVRLSGMPGIAGLGLILAGMAPSPAASLASLAQHVTEFQLGNGMRFAVMERRESPLFAVHLTVNAGPLDEPEGQAGISRLFPRMFANGGDLGVRNLAGEKAALARVEQAYEHWKKLEAQKPPADSYDVSKARVDFQMATEAAGAFAAPGFAFRVLEEAGAMSVEARFDADVTHYIAILPAQAAEVWFKLMSDWLKRPSARRFYDERNAWVEEANRASQQNQQTAVEDVILSAAFGKAGYGRKVSAQHDGPALRAAHFDSFARTYYVPANLSVAIAGDFAPAEARRLADLYFGAIPRSPAPPPPAVPPLRFETDRVTQTPAPPGVTMPAVVAWPRPPASDPDDAVFDVIWAVLASGREGLMAKTFEDERVPARASVVPNFPGHRAWSLFAISASPTGPTAREAVESAIGKAAARLAESPVEAALLARVKTALRTQLTSEAESVTGVCHLLARFLSSGGSAASIGKAEERIEKVSAEDVMRVAKKYFQGQGRLIVRPAGTEGGGL